MDTQTYRVASAFAAQAKPASSFSDEVFEHARERRAAAGTTVGASAEPVPGQGRSMPKAIVSAVIDEGRASDPCARPASHAVARVVRICNDLALPLWMGTAPGETSPEHGLPRLPTVLRPLRVEGDGEAGYRFYARSGIDTSDRRKSGAANVAGASLVMRVIEDDVVRHLAACLWPALLEPRAADPVFVELASSALQAHVAALVAAVRGRENRRRCSGGLAPWQERRALHLLTEHVDEQIPLADLASECRLSVSHFVRAFRQSTGLPPHRWLMERRVHRSKELLADPRHTLSEVALGSGFADQSHFTRLFARSVGMTPGAWRRFSAGQA